MCIRDSLHVDDAGYRVGAWHLRAAFHGAGCVRVVVCGEAVIADEVQAKPDDQRILNTLIAKHAKDKKTGIAVGLLEGLHCHCERSLWGPLRHLYTNVPYIPEGPVEYEDGKVHVRVGDPGARRGAFVARAFVVHGIWCTHLGPICDALGIERPLACAAGEAAIDAIVRATPRRAGRRHKAAAYETSHAAMEMEAVDEEAIVARFFEHLDDVDAARAGENDTGVARVHEQVAAKVSTTDENGSWILASVVRYDATSDAYAVQDEDDQKILELPASRIRRLGCLLYTSPSPRDRTRSRMPSSA